MEEAIRRYLVDRTVNEIYRTLTFVMLLFYIDVYAEAQLSLLCSSMVPRQKDKFMF